MSRILLFALEGVGYAHFVYGFILYWQSKFEQEISTRWSKFLRMTGGVLLASVCRLVRKGEVFVSLPEIPFLSPAIIIVCSIVMGVVLLSVLLFLFFKKKKAERQRRFLENPVTLMDSLDEEHRWMRNTLDEEH